MGSPSTLPRDVARNTCRNIRVATCAAQAFTTTLLCKHFAVGRDLRADNNIHFVHHNAPCGDRIEIVHKTKTDLNVICRKDGYEDAQTIIATKFGGATAANIIAGGIIGVGVDAASGANYSYADTTLVPMRLKVLAPVSEVRQVPVTTTVSAPPIM